MEGGSKNEKNICKDFIPGDRESDEKNSHILLLGVSDEDDGDTNILLPPGFSSNSFMLTDDTGDIEEDANIQYQFIDQDGNLVQLEDISVANLKLAQLNDYKIGWTKPMVKCLINCYRELILEFRDPMRKQKDVWTKVADIMKESGYQVSWSHCDRKWRNLKHTFKKYYYSKNESKKMAWEYYNDLLILFAPDCREEYKGKQRMSRIILPPGNFDDSASSSAEMKTIYVDNDDNTMEVSMEEIREESPPKWFTDFMEQFEQRQDMRIEKLKDMHEQSLKVERQKCKALEAILNKVTNKPG